MLQVRLAILLALASAAAPATQAQAADSTASGATSPTANISAIQRVAGSAGPASGRARNYVTANAAGLVVVVDRQTGGTRALTAEEAQTLAEGIKQLLDQSSDGLVQVQRADGSVSMDLQGRFQNAMLAKKEEDGSISQACVDNPEAAAAFFEIDPEVLSAAKRSVSQAATPLDIR